MSSPSPLSVTSKVFSTTELRCRIYRNLGKTSLAKCARVCSSWSGDALDLIWENLKSAIPLLSLICPLTENGYDKWCFTRAIKIRDWARFHVYADRIRSLTVGEYEALSSDLILEICQRRPANCLTPGLRELAIWRPELAVFSQVFMHTGLRKLDLVLPQNRADFEELMDDLISKTDSLECAHFYEDERTLDVGVLDEKLGRFFRHQGKMQTIGLQFLTTSIVDALPHLESLTKIVVTSSSHNSYPSFGTDYKVKPSMPSLQLTDLGIISSFEDAIPFLVHLPNLKKLWILARWVETSSSLQALITAASQACPSLSLLNIEGIPDNWDYSGATTEQKSACSVTLGTISALKGFRKLGRLEIVWPYPMNITEGDLSRLLPHSPDLSELYLNCSHIILDEDSALALPPSILPRIAEWCPKLQGLGLFLDCSGTLPLDTEVAHPPLNLTRFDLGVSHVCDSDTQVARYLANYCSDNCVFEVPRGRSWPYGVIEPKVTQKYGEKYTKGRWDDKRSRLQDLMKAFKASDGSSRK